MASIFRRGKTWWIHYLAGGRSVSRSLKTACERVAREEKKRLEALEVTDRLTRPSSTPIVPFLQSFGEFLRATQTRKSAKNDLSYLRQFFGPCCQALQLGSHVPHKFRQGRRSLPTMPDVFRR